MSCQFFNHAKSEDWLCRCVIQNVRLQVSARGNRLFPKFGLNPEVELTNHSESSFGTSRGELTLVAGTDSVTEYVYIGALGRSFARVR
jgi:hypothetical protein